jgi:tetratricopeptide (TPR) repeat protein
MKLKKHNMLLLLKRSLLGIFGLFYCGSLSAQMDLEKIDLWRQNLQNDNWQSTVDSCDKVIPVYRQRNSLEPLALALSLRGTAYRIGHLHQKSLTSHREALVIRKSLFGNHHETVSASYQNIGNCLLSMGKNKEAYIAFESALRIKKRIFPSDHPRLASTFNSLGQCHQAEGNADEAAVFFQQAFSINENYYGSSSPKIIGDLVSMADFYISQKSHDKALVFLQRAQQIYSDSVKNDPGLGILILNNMANTLAAKGDYSTALRCLQEAVRKCEQHQGLPQKLKGDALLNQGVILNAIGDFGSAYTVLESALLYFPMHSSDYANVLNSLGLVAFYQNEPLVAQKTLIKAGNMFLQAEPNNANRVAAAGVWRNLGNCYMGQGEFRTALYYYQDALQTLKQWPGTVSEQAACLDKIARCFIQLQDWPQSWQALAKAEHRLPLNAVLERFSVFYHRGDWFFAQKKYQDALFWYQKAAGLIESPITVAFPPYPFEQVQGKTAVARTLSVMAIENTEHWQTSLSVAKQAIVLLQELKNALKGERSGTEVQALLGEPFDIAVKACMAMGLPKQAWEYSEKFRLNYAQQVSLYTAMTQLAGKAADLSRLEQFWRIRLAYYQRKQIIEKSDTQIKDSIRIISDRIWNMRKQITEDFPEFFSFFLNPKTVDLESAQKVLKKDQCILTWHWADSSTLIGFVFRNHSFESKSISLQQGFSDSLHTFFAYCSQNPLLIPSSFRAAAFESQVRLGTYLYNQLIRPFEASLTENILIVPDDKLCFLPFDALIHSSGGPAHLFDRHTYLMHKYRVSYLQSVSSWILLKGNKLERSNLRLLAVAPDFKNNTHGLSSLFFNAQEARSVRQCPEKQFFRNCIPL